MKSLHATSSPPGCITRLFQSISIRMHSMGRHLGRKQRPCCPQIQSIQQVHLGLIKLEPKYVPILPDPLHPSALRKRHESALQRPTDQHLRRRDCTLRDLSHFRDCRFPALWVFVAPGPSTVVRAREGCTLVPRCRFVGSRRLVPAVDTTDGAIPALISISPSINFALQTSVNVLTRRGKKTHLNLIHTRQHPLATLPHLLQRLNAKITHPNRPRPTLPHKPSQHAPDIPPPRNGTMYENQVNVPSLLLPSNSHHTPRDTLIHLLPVAIPLANLGRQKQILPLDSPSSSSGRNTKPIIAPIR
ncbi:hypothetical protein Landi51_12495 [Colletotrichum acutatum]